MDEKTTRLASKGEARRRLVRGAFAAPAVMTLISGSALAATSVTCVVKQNTNPVDAGPNPDGTVWIRVPVWEKRNPTTDRFARFVSGGDIQSLMAPGGSYLASGSWQCIFNTFPITQNRPETFVVSSIYTTAQANAIRAFAFAQVANTYVAVRIDSAGKVVGVEPISPANTAMHTSCWTSFGGANPFV